MYVLGLGELKDDGNGFWISHGVAIPYFDGKALVVFLEAPLLDETMALAVLVDAITRFLSLTGADRLAATPYLFKHYRDFCEAVGNECVPGVITDQNEIWEHITPSAVRVERRKTDGLAYVTVEAECDWEIEHGMQLVYRGGASLSRVSLQDGHLTHSDAFGLPDDEDKIC